MAEPVIAAKAPIQIELEEGKNYFWCTCGKSSKQPLCDGSHKGSEFAPMKYTADATRTAWMCACKQTGKAPFCDGAHKKL
jgi:CDGSH iron-sulfur domain-containing protein 3